MVDSGTQVHKSMPRSGLETLLSVLSQEGYRLVGPTISEGAIVFDDIATTKDLPIGWTDRQSPGRYRLEKSGDDRAFGFVVGPHSWKQFLFPAKETLHQATYDESAGMWRQSDDHTVATAFIGVRACDLAGIGIQDRVFIGGKYVDQGYHNRRHSHFIVAVNCLQAGDLCFCDSMGTGPEVKSGFDICLTELDSTFLVQAGSERGDSIVAQLPLAAASQDEHKALLTGLAQCRQSMGRQLDTENIEGLLFGNLEHPQWEDVSERCLACGNCTMVCPTCFCYSVDEVADLGDDPPQRERSWDSCFSQQHSKINGATFQPAIKDRYRQWLTHKLASWQSQFGTSGCVGCGRCIAWCPVGIDLTEEVAAIRVGAEEPVSMPACETVTIAPATEQDAGESTTPIFATTEATVAGVVTEAPKVATLALTMPVGYDYQPGQFNMLSLPGIGEVPISVSGDSDGAFEHTIHSVGNVSEALNGLEPGSTLGVRGPYGSSWPMALARSRPVTVIAGGLGLAPLRGVIRRLLEQAESGSRNGDTEWLRLIYGARHPEALLFTRELEQWRKNPAFRVAVTVDQSTSGWTGNVGTVITFLSRKRIPVESLYLVCGPEVMMLAVVRVLLDAQVPPEHIYLSMERNMKCAAGHCGRCQYGPYFICKDGPVLGYDKLSFLFGKRGF
ncbi:hypothetical protein HBA55_35910 [Pseudomaricurvus alkylphenolicus]|uniref:4Fe-4S dicluster domain-containing protein n=1 Tax=Pseudomaricurvus alkylphenolicus TaxID=1306991 RepID=UPI0014209956|nr:4Fe-4S dicluster domain-containing protein [Pseudomaricurvus alkylphenolicus]NIB45021.1 hypothetical protein [Pseudomaricurvus alkylphenolicus]